MRIKWYPTGRDLWFDLAIKLKSKDILKSSSLRSVHILKWLVASRTLHVIPGTVNPNNDRYLINWYTGDAFRTAGVGILSDFKYLKKGVAELNNRN
ncbi:MAG: hypothetical protein CM15mP54_17800 [Paracoccaceae bacterium]|nr:MAG: hypothetical protein CM15mP54_17800 [Paracoccaceae bacterium]